MGGIAQGVIALLDGPAETAIPSKLGGAIESLSILRRSLLFLVDAAKPQAVCGGEALRPSR